MEGGEHLQLLELEAASHHDVDQLAKVPLRDKARSQKLSAAIQDKLARIRALTRDLELEVEELDSDEERATAAAQLAQHKAEYARLQAALRDAALAQRTAALRSAQEERRELLAGGDVGLRQRKMQAEGDALAAAEEVTGGLRRTRQVLAEELEHTSATLAAMDSSHTALGRTRDEYHGQHRKLRQSRGLLGTLSWQTKSETYMLWMGLTLFLAVCAYVAQKRAGHFVPDRLKPSSLLAALTSHGGGGAQRVGRQPLEAPSARLRAQAPPPGPRQEQALQHRKPSPPLPREPAAEGEEEAKGGAWPPTAPYGSFVGQDEAEEDAAAYGVYMQPPRKQQKQQKQQQQEQEQHLEHEPAEWPTGSPEPHHQVEADPAGGEQQQQDEQQQHEPAEWPTGSPEPHHQAEAHPTAGKQQQQQQQEQQHEPAEWPTGGPEPHEQVQAGAAASAEQREHEYELQQEQPALADDERPAAAEGQRQGVERQPFVEDPPLPALDERLAAEADARRVAAEEREAAAEAAARAAEQEAAAQSAAAAAEQEAATVAARAAEQDAPSGSVAAAQEQEVPVAEDPPLPVVDVQLEAEHRGEHPGAAAGEEGASAVGPEGGPEPGHIGSAADQLPAAGAAEEVQAQAQAPPQQGVEQQERSTIVTDRHGRRIAVDGPDFVRTPPLPPAHVAGQQGRQAGQAGQQAEQGVVVDQEEQPVAGEEATRDEL